MIVLSRHLKFVICLTFVCFFIVACDKPEYLLDDLYRFENLERIELQKTEKLDYFLGYDNYAIPLQTKVYDINGAVIKTPEKAISYYSNGDKLPAESFMPEKTGVFELVGKLAGKESNTLSLHVWDLKDLSIRVSAQNRPSNEIIANGSDAISFKAELISEDGVIPGDFPIYIYVNDRQVSGTFSTSVPGDYQVVARGLGLTSKTLNIKATAPTTYAVVRLPVIFHEVNTQNLTAAKVKELTDGMTRAFRNTLNRSGKAKDVNATDIRVEFYPAPTGLNGNRLASAGLERVSSGNTDFTFEDIYSDAFKTFWDPEYYLNIWVYPNIKGDYANASWAFHPYVTEPLAGLRVLDKSVSPGMPFGIFLNARHLVGQNTDEILSHEAGHILGLLHVFSGDLTEFNGCPTTDPDYCADTPYYDRAAYAENMPSVYDDRFKRTSCRGSGYVATNFMDYFYSYNNSFTSEQFKRVRHVVSYGLWLPTPFNSLKNGRTDGTVSVVKRPDHLEIVKPVVCKMP